MYEQWLANGTVAAATLLSIALAVLVHYEGLVLTQRRIAQEHVRRRLKVLHAISLLIVLHVVEIWVFGVMMWMLLLWPACGSIAGPASAHFLDSIYLSAVSYTTVGFGDVAPVGPIRLLVATESLVGLVLITWSASFTYIEMERFWREAR
jgi:hypothetical protein